MFKQPEEMPKKMLDKLEEEAHVNRSQISTLSFSITGDVNSDKGIVISSDRLAEFSDTSDKYNNYEWVKRFEKELNNPNTDLRIMHDGYCHSYAAAFMSQKTPLMVIALGTMPNVSVFDIAKDGKNEKIKLYCCESFTKIKMYAEGGKCVEVCELLSKETIHNLKEKLNDDKKFYKTLSIRINAAIKEWLIAYAKQFDGQQPHTVVFSGGNVQFLDRDILQTDIATPIDLMLEEEQLENLFLACIDFSKKHGICDLHKC
ncbi:hypothetical protein AKO1_003468 [Acrasis kona]|uniref:Uncharacterized protein n=1 Tax=Acrasis kona TaxID=1008807 RepID=A0AAW2Z6U6_9EUKA